jgi:hypothetical protein
MDHGSRAPFNSVKKEEEEEERQKPRVNAWAFGISL